MKGFISYSKESNPKAIKKEDSLQYTRRNDMISAP